MKWWNTHEVTLRAVLEVMFVCFLIEMADAEITMSVTRFSVCVKENVKENARYELMLIRSRKSVENE